MHLEDSISLIIALSGSQLIPKHALIEPYQALRYQVLMGPYEALKWPYHALRWSYHTLKEPYHLLSSQMVL